MPGHLRRQNSVGGCAVTSQNPLLKSMKNLKNLLCIHPCSAGKARFIHPAPCALFFFVILEHKVTCKQNEFVSCTCGGIKHYCRKKSPDKYGRKMTVNRLTWREILREGEREKDRENKGERERRVASGTIHLPSTILDFPTFQN